MNVLHLIKTSEGATWALRQMRELVKMGVEVHVAMPVNGPLVKEYNENGIVIHEIDYSLKNIVLTLKNMRKIIKEVKPDIIHSHFAKTTLFMRLALRRNNTPRVFQVPGPLHLESILYRLFDVLSAQKNDYWIASCNWTNARYIKSGVSASKVFLSYYGTDIQHLVATKGILRKELNLKEGDIIIAMVAYMYAPKQHLGKKRGIKGHEDFIEAMSVLVNKYPNLYAVCIGGAWNNAMWYENELIEYGKMQCGDKIKFMGTRNDVPDLYNDIDIVIHPSHSENLGGAAESLLLSVPTIATNVGGFPDIVIHGRTGMLVDKGKPKQIIAAVEYMMKNEVKRKEMAKNGKELVCNILDVKNSAKKVYDIYKTILN